MKIDFEEYTKGKYFITDLGIQESTYNPNSSENISPGRYGVWSPFENESGNHRVIEAGNDLNALQEKYEISDEYILTINQD